MRFFRDNAVGEWIIFGIAVMAFFIAAKYAVSYLPDGGLAGGFKNVVNAA